MVQRVDKDSLKLDQPRRTPGHPTKSHIVKTRVDGKEKIIRFGEQGAETAGKPKEGESERMKTKRASFKARHAKNIAKGKSSPAYWANKVKWADGGAVTGMAVGGGWGQMAAAGPVGGSAKVASDAVQARESLARAAASMREAYGGQPTSTRPAAVTARDDRAAPGTYSGTGVRGFTYDAGDPELGIRPSVRLNGDDVAPGMRDLARSYGVDDGEDYVPASLTQPVVAVSPAAPIAEQPTQAPGFFAQLLQAPKAIGQDLMMGYRAGIFSPRDVQEQNLLRAEYTPAAIADYFARTDATRARMDAAAPSGIDRSEAMPAQGDLAQAFAREYNIVGRNRSQLMPLLEAFLRGRGITDPSTYADNIFNTLSIPMQQGGAVELNEIYQKYMPFTSDRDMIGQMERYLENIRRAQGGADEQAKRERDVVIGAFAPPPRPTPNDYLREKGATPEIEGYRQAAIKAAEKYGIPPNIFLSLVRTESNFNPLAKSGKGAMGLVQLMPKTAEELGVTDPFDPMQNLDGGARYLAQQYNRFGEWPLALSAYNAGASNVLKYDGIPPFEETKNYVDKVMRGAGILKYADGGAVEAEDDPSFFSLSGQERRRALDDLNARIGESLRYYLGPTPIPQILGLASEMTPSRTVERASEASQRMVEPGLSPLERIGAGAEMLGEVAAVGAPLAVGARGAMPMAEAAQEAFMGLSVPTRAAAQEIVDRLNQPGPMPVLGSNFGNIGQGRPTIADLQEAPLAEMPRITPSDLVGARIIPTVADLTRAGGYYRGIDASQIDVPEPMMGGPGYPLLPSSQQAGLAWAVQGKSMETKKGLKGADLIAVTAMNPTSHKSNISFINSLIKTTGAYVRDDRIPPQVLGELDARVRAASTGPGLSNLETFPGFENPNLQEWISNASFEDRSRIADIIATKEMQGLGLPNVNRVLQETVDPRYAGANPRDTLFFIEPDFSLPVVDLRAEGLPIHPSYRYGLRGRVFGALDQNISTFEMFPEFWGEKNVSAFGPNFDKGGRRAFDLSIPITDFTNQRAEEIERIIRSSASNYGPTRAAARLSPIDTRIVVNSMLDRWKPSTKPVNAGGVSPQAFADAINNSKYRPALTNYTAADVKAGAKSGDFTVYQLGDDEVFFGIDAKPDYSWAGVEMMPGDKALVGVVSNAPGAKGTAAPSVMAKAIEEGVTVLDAFAVPSQKFPDGFLPRYYGKFGFQEVGRVPFDPELYIADHGEQAYKDLRAAWKSDGWDESMGMPPVIVMRWSGNDADRRAAATGIRGAGSPSTRAEPEGLIPEARGSSGRGSERSVPSESSGVGRGTAGGAGAGDAVRLAARAGEPAAGILGLSPRELQNRGISRDQIKDLARKYELDLPPDFARGGTVRAQPKGYAAGGLVTPFDPAMIDQIVNRVKGAARV
jgi:hypothetical protein